MNRVLASDEGAVQQATTAMDEGGLVVLPTDTSYVLAADALMEEAVLRVFEAQRRPADEALTVCVGGWEDLHHVAFATPLAQHLAAKHWPGPVTLILRARHWLPDALTAGGPTVAVRLPANAYARDLAKNFGPFVAARAPRTHEAGCADIEEAIASLGNHASLYVDGGALSLVSNTIVDATGSEPKVLTAGAVAASEIAPHGS